MMYLFSFICVFKNTLGNYIMGNKFNQLSFKRKGAYYVEEKNERKREAVETTIC